MFKILLIAGLAIVPREYTVTPEVHSFLMSECKGQIQDILRGIHGREQQWIAETFLRLRRLGSVPPYRIDYCKKHGVT